MRKIGAVLGAIGIIAACGGHVEGENDTKPCPNDFSTSCREKTQCTLAFEQCYGVTATETCNCVDGHWLCPGTTPCTNPKPPPKPPGTTDCSQIHVVDDAECVQEGLTCPAAYTNICGTHASCLCVAGQWNCSTQVCLDAGFPVDASSD